MSYSIPIGRDRLLALSRTGGVGKITHPPTARWKSLLNKRIKYIRFYNITFDESIVCKVKSVHIVKQANEFVIQITTSKAT